MSIKIGVKTSIFIFQKFRNLLLNFNRFFGYSTNIFWLEQPILVATTTGLVNQPFLPIIFGWVELLV